MASENDDFLEVIDDRYDNEDDVDIEDNEKTMREDERSRSRSPVPRREKETINVEGNTWRDKLDTLFDKGLFGKEDIEATVLEDLGSMKEEEAIYVVESASTVDYSKIKNISGFLGGIIRRVKEDGIDGEGITLESLGPSIQGQIESLIEEGKFGKDDVDARVIKALRKLSDRDREEALRRYTSSLDDTVRSKQGFFMGIIKRLGRPPHGPPRGDYRRGPDRSFRPRSSRYDGGSYYRRDRSGDGSRDYRRDSLDRRSNDLRRDRYDDRDRYRDRRLDRYGGEGPYRNSRR